MTRAMRAGLAALLASAAWGHMLSMSSGDVTVTGDRARYELRMPIYEMAHVQDAERLFSHIRFAGARLLEKSCMDDAGSGVFRCTADYQFSAPPDRLEIECRFHAVTVPHHVHLLRAQMGEKRDQALFDISFPKATLRFAPPTPSEIALTQMGGGLARALGGWVQILFLASLVLAARSRRELLALAGMFLLGQAAAAVIVPYTAWQPAPRFVEAAAALTIAYLAVEILLLPEAGRRWLVAAVLGGFHGLYFELFLRTTQYQAVWVLGGAALGEIACIALFALLFSRVGRAARVLRPVKVSASLLLVIGMVWFFMRLRS